MSQPRTEPVYRTYDGVEFEILPLSNFTCSELVSTSSELLASMITPEDEERDDRVAQAKKARAAVKDPYYHFASQEWHNTKRKRRDA